LYELVIFDSDGVLVDSEGISNRVLAATLTARGLPTSAEQALLDYKGRILADVIALANERNGAPLDDWVDEFESNRADAFRAELKEIDGVRSVVEAVRDAGVDLCVCSQGKPNKTALTLGITGLRELFDDQAIFTSYEVERGKPHPDLFLHAAATRGASPSQTAVVEDTLIGARAGIAAGMTVFGYASETPAEEFEALGARPFSQMAELPALLGVAAT
jgi:HAD superfamily hydrolase (TIGR01509 family)